MVEYGNEFLGKSEDSAGNSGSPQIKIVTVGVGGGGNNTVNRLLKVGVKGTDLVAVNTDVTHFKIVDDRIKKVLIGKSMTRGLGAGGDPEVGAKAAEADRQQLEEVLSGAQLVFLCAGMGGGTGTGAIPVIAQIAKEQGAIVVAMVTYPFDLERVRKVKAEEGINRLRKFSDSVIILDNNRLVKLVPNLPMNEAFAVADDILAKAIGGLVWTITQPSLINIDFADVRSIMGSGDVGFISVGTGKGNDKVGSAAEAVLKNKLLDVDFENAKGALIHISGASDLSLGDAIKAGEIITERMDPKANVKWGARIIPGYEGQLEIVAIVTGVRGSSIVGKFEDQPSQVKYGGLEMI
ncbi:MAG: cell division protein FtsZ [Candidatus Micrarchaeota archaeon]|nr:cell division protein FtsZ [Candidatus Micrarchaeota archaeon]MDE1834094.1 cell division protein FtsZ [Candidatus Micrarchaeota archaeon]MDE1859734.1 cell division protein FtsZ [Candidatus Micrarchaeota archaeon]